MAQGDIPLVEPNGLAKPLRRAPAEETILQNGTISTDHSDKSDLAGTQGQARQKGAVRKVFFLNWRGIVHTTMTMIFTNFVLFSFSLNLCESTFTWLSMLRAAMQGTEAAAAATVAWYQCVLDAGSHSPRCETLAAKIVNLRAIWTVELILSILGIMTFILETSRRYLSQLQC